MPQLSARGNIYTDDPCDYAEFLVNNYFIVHEDFNEKEIRIEGDKVRICILTLEGPMWCSGDDYIIRGVHGELYPCRRHVFLDSYVPHTPYRHMEETDGIYD